jgi:2-polyprenyl-3-methyl-5-hydroxy-6-metoxy-1,4-benzoquinol methylase
VARNWHGYLHIPRWLSISRGPVEHLLRDVSKNRQFKVLDVGCGYGRISEFLKSEGMDVSAVDSDERMVEITQKKGIKTYQMDAGHLSFEDASFDLVLTDGLLEHFPRMEDITSILKEEARVSRQYIVNLIPSNTFLNKVLEKVQRCPPEYRDRDWEQIHREAVDLAFSLTVKKLLRLNAFILCKS